MNTLTENQNFEFGVLKKPDKVRLEASEKRIVISDRDCEVLGFILEMKFASLDEVCEKFFKGSPANQNIVGYWYAKKRLAQLQKAGFLDSTKRFCESRRFYFAKKQAYIFLRNIRPEKVYPRPTGDIDARTVLHDYLTLKMRLELEKRYQAYSWISDRCLRMQSEQLAPAGAAYSPDGIYTPAEGHSVAFELEISLKSKSRYQDKIKRYVQWIRLNRNNPKAIKSVHFVVTNETVKRHLDNFTKIYQDIFKVELINQYFAESVGLK